VCNSLVTLGTSIEREADFEEMLWIHDLSRDRLMRMLEDDNGNHNNSVDYTAPASLEENQPQEKCGS
jgi:hypothetical protein